MVALCQCFSDTFAKGFTYKCLLLVCVSFCCNSCVNNVNLDVVSGSQTELPERGKVTGNISCLLTHQQVPQCHATDNREHTTHTHTKTERRTHNTHTNYGAIMHNVYTVGVKKTFQLSFNAIPFVLARNRTESACNVAELRAISRRLVQYRFVPSSPVL